MELDADPSGTLTFREWAWCKIYCGRMLAPTEQEALDWEAALRQSVHEDTWPLPDPWKSELELSWQRLFDPELQPWHDIPSDKPRNDNSIAVFEALDLAKVVAVTQFIGDSRYGRG